MTLTWPVGLKAEVSLRWQSTGSDLSPELSQHLQDNNLFSDFVKLISKSFRFEHELIINFGGTGIPGYNRETHTIHMPADYFAHAVQAQYALSDDPNDPQVIERALELVEYTLYHLLGHSLAGTSEEIADDTVEAVSTYLVVAFWPNGAEQWLADVRAFAQASQKLNGSLNDYWHSHALYPIRQQTIVCWILGSNPERWVGTLEAELAEAANTETCRASWIKLEASMQTLLEPVLLPDATLRLRRQR